MIDTIRTATEHFWDFLSEISIVPLLAAIACQILKLACVSRAWRNVLAAAYPDRPVPWPPIGAAYVAGVGVNAIVPARGGDVVRIYLAHRAIPGSSYTTVISSTVVLTFVDLVLSLAVFVWAVSQGLLPSIDVLSRLPSFDYSWAFKDGVIHPGVVIAIVGVGALAVWLLNRYWYRLRARVEQAFAVFDPPHRYVRTVVVWQLGDWTLRLATIWFFLGAFGIHQSVTNVLLVQAAMSLSTLVPATPGGIGTEQALLVYAFRNGGIAETTLLAFSVGMKLTLTVVNVVLGFTAIFLTLGTVRYRSVVSPPAEPAGPVDER